MEAIRFLEILLRNYFLRMLKLNMIVLSHSKNVGQTKFATTAVLLGLKFLIILLLFLLLLLLLLENDQGQNSIQGMSFQGCLPILT